MDERYAKVWIVLGKKLSGKTNKTLTKLYKACQQNRRKVLIVDFADEFGNYVYRKGTTNHSIKAIYLKHIPRFAAQRYPEIVRIRPFWDDGRIMSTDDMQTALSQVLNTYYNGILLLEDINKYIPDTINNSLIGRLSTVRQAGVDVIIHYQLIEKAGNPKLLGNLNYIRLHKTTGSVERHADKYGDKTEVLSIAEIIVANRHKYGVQNKIFNETGIFFNVEIDCDILKIYGIFTKDEAKAAIKTYISRNSRTTINNLLNEMDERGSKVYKTYADAYATCAKQIMDDYFDF